MDCDRDNLREFSRSGDEMAFRRMVESHAPMVFGVAWRHSRDRVLAEDVTQTVFTILARKAGSLTHGELAGWLHRAALIESRNATRKEARRRKTLTEYQTAMSDDDASPAAPAWREILPHLDDVIGCLKPEERQLVVMRFFEKRSYREISATTGRTEENSRKRMQRTLDRMGGLLKRRGVIAPGTALGTVLAGQTLCAPPASAALIAATALKGAPAVAGSATFLHSLYLMTTQTVLKTTAVVLVIAAVPVALLWQQNHELKNEIGQLKGGSSTYLTEAESSSTPEALVAQRQRSGQRTEREKTAVDLQKSQAELVSSLIAVEAKMQISQQVARLKARLHLSDVQQQQLTAFLERRNDTKQAMIAEMTEAGTLERSESGEDSLTEGDKQLIAKLFEQKRQEQTLDAFLPTILDPEQAATQKKGEEDRRSETAQTAAQITLSQLSGRIDLSDDQKNRLYQMVVDRNLAPPKPPDNQQPFSATMQAALIQTADREDNSPPGGAENDDALLSQVLTAEQMETLKNSRQEEAARDQQTIQIMTEKVKGKK